MKTSTNTKQEALQFSQDSQQYLEEVKNIFVDFFNAQDEKNKQPSLFGKVSQALGRNSKPKISKTNLFLKFYNLILLGEAFTLTQDVPEDVKQAVAYMQVLVQQAKQMDTLFVIPDNPLDKQVQEAVDELRALNNELKPHIEPVKSQYQALHNKYKKLHSEQEKQSLAKEISSDTSTNLAQKEQQLKAVKELYENLQRENDELAALYAEISDPKYEQLKELKQQKVAEAYQKYFNQLKEKNAALSDLFAQVQQNIKQQPLSPAFNEIAGELQIKASEQNSKNVQRYSEKITQPLSKLKEEIKAQQQSTKKVEQFAQIAQQIYAARFEKAQKVADSDFDKKLAEVDKFKNKINLIMFSQMEAIGKLEKEIKQEKLEAEKLEAERQAQLKLEEQQKLNAERQDQVVTDEWHEAEAPTSPQAQGGASVALDKLQGEVSTVKESGHGQVVDKSKDALKQQLEKYLQDRDPSKAKGFKWISLSLQYNTSSLRQEKVKAVEAYLKALEKPDSAEALEKLKAKHIDLISPKTTSRFCLFSKSEAKKKGELGRILDSVENANSNNTILKI